MQCDRLMLMVGLSFFFFQAEDGIRYGRVTGVQTCALPISAQRRDRVRLQRRPDLCQPRRPRRWQLALRRGDHERRLEIGRASCRERVWILVPRVALIMNHTPTAISIFVCLSMVQLLAD